MPSEADTCRKFVVPKLQAAGWDTEPCSIAEQRTIADGRIVPVGKGFIRKPPKRRTTSFGSGATSLSRLCRGSHDEISLLLLPLRGTSSEQQGRSSA